MSASPLRCTHLRVPRVPLWHRGVRGDSPCLERAELCRDCRRAASDQGIRLLLASGEAWREPDELLRATRQTGADPSQTERAAPTPSSAVVVEEGVSAGAPTTSEGTMTTRAPCSYPGCQKPVKARGYCGAHYESEHRKVRRVRKPAAPAAEGPPAKADAADLERAKGRIRELEDLLDERVQGLEKLRDQVVMVLDDLERVGIATPVSDDAEPPLRVRALGEQLRVAQADRNRLVHLVTEWQERALLAERVSTDQERELEVLRARLDAWGVVERLGGNAESLLLDHLRDIGAGRHEL